VSVFSGEVQTQNGFASLGQPDIAATLAAVAGEALKAVWYQKWWVHLRHRPESGGAIVHLMKTGQAGTIQGHVSNTVLNSQAVQDSFVANQNSYFLSQAFPEGSPTHPAYPTGHGTVAGACITALKFFFDGTATFQDPVVPSSDGITLSKYNAPAGEGGRFRDAGRHKFGAYCEQSRPRATRAPLRFATGKT
jgi:hypothetical protein